MKKIREWLFGSVHHRYINGGKGVISIFLAALMIPFVLQADMLIEVSRYHAVIAALENVMDVAATCTLSDYDSFLLQRFGLLAMNQKQGTGGANGTTVDADRDLTETYTKYFNANLEGGQIAWESSGVTVKGQYPLSDQQVLKKQILESTKYSVPTELASGFTMYIIQFFTEKSKGIQLANACMDMATATVNELDHIAQVISTGEELVNETRDLETNKTRYEEKFDAFKSATEAVAAKKAEIAQKQQEQSQQESQAATKRSEAASVESQIRSIRTEMSQLDEKLANEEVTEEEYQSQKDSLQTQLNELQSQYETASSESSNAQSAASSAQNQIAQAQRELQQKESAAESAKNEYASSIRTVKASLEAVSSKTDKVFDNIVDTLTGVIDVQKSWDKVGDAQNDYDTSKTEDKLEETIADLTEQISKAENDEQREALKSQKEGAKAELKNLRDNNTKLGDENTVAQNQKTQVENEVNSLKAEVDYGLEEYNKNTIDRVCAALQGLYNLVSTFPVSQISSDFTCEREIYYVLVEGYASYDRVNSMLLKLNEEYNASDDEADGPMVGLFAFLKAVSELVDAILKINLFYDASLDAVIKTSLMQNEPSGIDNLLSAIGTFNADLFEAAIHLNLEKLCKAFHDMIGIVRCIIAYVESMAAKLTGLGELFGNGLSGAYEKVLISDYLNLTCANRTNYTKKNILTGYSFANAGMGSARHEEDTFTIMGAGSALTNAILSFGSGDSNLFRGAETEYLLTGSRCEIVNQTSVFFQIYLIRLIVDAVYFATGKNVEVQTILAASSLGSGIVSLIYLIVEPLLDTIILVNGEKLDLGKDCFYLTPTGLPTLVSHLLNIGLTSAEKDGITGKMEETLKRYEKPNLPAGGAQTGANGSGSAASSGSGGSSPGTPSEDDRPKQGKDSDSFVTATYQTYLNLFLLMQEEELSLKRFSNIIYTESKNQKNSFDMDKTYTYLNAEAKGKYQPFLNVAEVITTFAFTGTKQQLRGY